MWRRIAAATLSLAVLAILGLAFVRGGPGPARSARPGERTTPPEPPDDLALLVARLRDPDPDLRVDAAVALRAFGDRAVPPFVDLLRHGDAHGRALAARSLGKLGAAAAPAVPAILQALDADPALRLVAVEALAAIGDREAAGPLLALLRDPDPALVLATLKALAALKPDTAEAALAIGALLPTNRVALDALKAMGPSALPALPTLLAAFENSDLLSPAIEVIAAIGPAARAAAPALVAVIVEEELKDAEKLRRMLEEMEPVLGGSFGTHPGYGARRALAAIGEAAIREVLAMLSHELGGVRGAGADILAEMGDAAVPHLVGAAGSGDACVREAAAAAMAHHAKKHPELLSTLARLATDEDADVRISALNALGAYGPDAGRILVAALAETDDETLAVALGSLARASPREPAAVPRLVELLDAEESLVRWNAAEALAAMGDASEKGIPALAGCMGDECEYMREYAREALEKLGDRAVPALLAEIDRAPAHGQRDMLALLARRKTLAEDERAACRRMLTSADGAVRIHAASALAVHGEESDAILPLLLGGLGDDRSETRRAAAAGIQAMGTRAAAAVPELFRAVREERARESNRLYVLDDMLAAVCRDDPTPLASALAEDSLRFDAGYALRTIGDPAAPALATLIDEGPYEAAVEAAASLGQIGKTGPAARAALLHARATRRPGVRLAVLKALWTATRDAPKVVEGLLDLARSGPEGVRGSAAYSLSVIGANAAFAIKAIRAAHAASTDGGVRSMLSKAIEAIETR